MQDVNAKHVVVSLQRLVRLFDERPRIVRLQNVENTSICRMIAAVKALEVCTKLVRHIGDCQATQTST